MQSVSEPPNFATRRIRMVDWQLAERGIRDPRVLEALRTVPREAFVPAHLTENAYEDRALPIGLGQTISQPYIVGYMTEQLGVGPDHRVLEIGTGTGYQTAILARLARTVITMERFDAFSEAARRRLNDLGVRNVVFRVGDGSLGCPDAAPYDRILVTAAAPDLVQPLVNQLADGGRMVLPLGEDSSQHLALVERCRGRTIERPLIGVRFVRLVGAAGHPD